MHPLQAYTVLNASAAAQVFGAVIFDSQSVPVRYRIRLDKSLRAPGTNAFNFTSAYTGTSVAHF